MIPGLWDMHVHYPENDTLQRLFLRHRVTGVREMGSSIERVTRNRARIAAGQWTGPRYVTSVLYLDGPSGYRQAGATLNPTTVAEAGAAVDSVARLGAAFVKNSRRAFPSRVPRDHLGGARETSDGRRGTGLATCRSTS